MIIKKEGETNSATRIRRSALDARFVGPLDDRRVCRHGAVLRFFNQSGVSRSVLRERIRGA